MNPIYIAKQQAALRADDEGLAEKILSKNKQQRTPLAEAILKGSENEIKALLDVGASKSVFVKSYAPGTLVCTLPMAQQPHGTSFEYPPPIKNVRPQILAQIDAAVANHINDMIDMKNASDAKKAADAIKSSTAVGESDQESSEPKPPTFDHYPTMLKVDDLVRRGPDWKWNDQDGNPPCIGIVRDVRQSTDFQISIEWGSSPKSFNGGGGMRAMYRYDSVKGVYDVFKVDPFNPTATPKNVSSPAIYQPPPKFRIGDKIRLSTTTAETDGCLGKPSDYKFGVVIKSKKPALECRNSHGLVVFNGANYTCNRCQSNKTGRRHRCVACDYDVCFNCRGENAMDLMVMSLNDGNIGRYDSSNLIYADGSPFGHVDFNHTKPPGIGKSC